MLTTKVCEKCGHPAPPSSNFCERCGATLLNRAAVGASAPPSAHASPAAHQGTRRISAGLFLSILVCFFLPFILVSCDNGPPLGTIHGIQLVTGFTAGGEYQHPVPVAVIAFLAAIIGLVGSLVLTKGRALVAAMVSAIGGLCVFLLKIGADYEAARSVLSVQYKEGFWLTLLLFIGAAIYHTRLLMRGKSLRP